MQKTYIGYARVSTEDQNEARELESFRIFREPISQTPIDKCSDKMNWLNQEMVFFENEERVLITEKNAAVTAAAECADEELAYQI